MRPIFLDNIALRQINSLLANHFYPMHLDTTNLLLRDHVGIWNNEFIRLNVYIQMFMKKKQYLVEREVLKQTTYSTESPKYG